VHTESRDGESHLTAEDIVSVFWNCLYRKKIEARTLYFRSGEEKGGTSRRDQETVTLGINANPLHHNAKELKLLQL
jgi:hypothetical protein